MQLREVVEASAALRATRSRTEKVRLIAALLAEVGTDEAQIAVAFLSGQPRQDRLAIGWAGLRDLTVAPAGEATLTLTEVDVVLQALADASGSGSRGQRVELLESLFSRASADEQPWLRGLILRELRQGALEGVVVQAVAVAHDVPVEVVRRAAMLSGDLGLVARIARTGGTAELAELELEVFRPVRPMLAATSPDVAAAIATLGTVIVEEKLDGARVQVHRRGDEVRVYTRNLREVTHRVPEVVAAAMALDLTSAVLDGEVLALDRDGWPRPFQETMSRFGREEVADPAEEPLTVRFFDLLHVDGAQVLDLPTESRRRELHRHVPVEHRVRSALTDDVAVATSFLRDTLDRGHEGVMVKALDVPYEAGRRGSGWRKVKPVHTLDLVVLAAEWGSGRRTGWLSNLHLGARDPDTDGFVMLGKTFKGLTDETLAWQTEALLAREVRRTKRVVHVRPDLVVEIAIDGVQTSSTYPGGVALRFARVKGYRPDRSAEDADTIATVRAIHRGELRPAVPGEVTT